MTLCDLKPGEKGVISQVELAGAARDRLMDMGLVPGAEVQLCRAAPLGGPVEFMIRGYALTLRRGEAEGILLGGNARAVIALAGNPNSGKTTLFNQLTGSDQHVGNFPGVTVEQKRGRLRSAPEFEVVDLPGLYSLAPYSGEEVIARDFLAGTPPAAIINIVDATCLARGLNLTLQLLEWGIPVVVALNMMDEVRAGGGSVDCAGLAEELGAPVAPIEARSGAGVEKLVQTVLQAARSGQRREAGQENPAQARYREIDRMVRRCTAEGRNPAWRQGTRRTDRILTHPLLGIPLFLLVMFVVFVMTFHVVGSRAGEGLEALMAWLGRLAASQITQPVLKSLVVDGVFAGVGSVLTFLPTILTLFFFLALMEDSGYFARVAFLMDAPLSKLGLSGKSIVPLLIGFGCSVPAIMATRTLGTERDRRMTLLLVPFMSCSAKAPIYAVFSQAFFPEQAALVMLGLYALGILVGILTAFLYRKTLFRGGSEPLILELPPYRLPTVRNVALHMWGRAKDFFGRAFGVIFFASLAVWLLCRCNLRLEQVADPGESILAMLGKRIAPVFAPLGFGDWRAACALLAGLSAKEAVVSTLAVLTGGSLAAVFTPLSALPFLVFTLLYMPCVAALSALGREMGNRLEACCAMAFQCGIAWLCAYAVHMVCG